MLKKEYDKRKKAAKKAAEISKACEGADAISSYLYNETSNQTTEDTGRAVVWGTALAIMLIVVLI